MPLLLGIFIVVAAARLSCTFRLVLHFPVADEFRKENAKKKGAFDEMDAAEFLHVGFNMVGRECEIGIELELAGESSLGLCPNWEDTAMKGRVRVETEPREQ